MGIQRARFYVSLRRGQGKAVRGLFLPWTLFISVASAQELEPRSYVNVPINQHFLAVGALRSEGGLAPSPGTPIENAELTLDTAVVGYATTLDLGGKSGKFDVAGTRTCLEGRAILDGERIEGKRCGWGDPSFKFSYNFLGAPSLSLDEFRGWQPGFVMGAGLTVVAPWGTYRPEALINTGGNRWVVRPSLGMSNTHGRFSWDAMVSVRFYEDNDEYLDDVVLEQDPLYQFQGHLIYALPRRQWVSLNFNYFFGSRTTQNGDERDDRQENSRWGFTWTIPLNAKHSLKVNGSTGVITRVGNDFDSLGLFWQYRF